MTEELHSFQSKLSHCWQAHRSLLCVGLDPVPSKIPPVLQSTKDPIYEFLTAIVSATKDSVCAFKPQIAFFAAMRQEETLERLIEHIRSVAPAVPIILDSKRGDIGTTSAAYAKEAFERYRADAVTVNPYLGHDSIAPFLEHRNCGVFALCRTSNPGARDLQDLLIEGDPLYLHVAKLAANHWNAHGNLGLVVGATYPEELGAVRSVVGEMPLLVPGVGAQGGTVADVMANGLTSARTGVIINASRAVLYASSGEDFREAATSVAQQLVSEMRQYTDTFSAQNDGKS